MASEKPLLQGIQWLGTKLGIRDPFAERVQALYSVNHWNLCFTELRGKLSEEGRVIRKDLRLTEISSLCAVDDEPNIIVLDAKLKLLATVDLTNMEELKPEAKWIWEDSAPTQVANLRSLIFCLIPEKNLIDVLQLERENEVSKCIQRGQIKIPEGAVDGTSRMTALQTNDSEFLIVGTTAGGLLRINLLTGDCDQLNIQNSKEEGSSISLGKTFCLSVDAQAGTIIVGDSLNSRILEVNPATGGTTLLVGGTEPGRSYEQDLAETAKIGVPTAVGIVSPRHHVSRSLLSRKSQDLCDRNKGQNRPRAIVFFDTAQEALRRVVELPDDNELLHYRGHRGVYTLAGIPYIRSFTPTREPALFIRDLRISDFTIARTGDLIAAIFPSTLLVIQPASARTSSFIAHSAKRQQIDET